jgi:hypothetical protein
VQLNEEWLSELEVASYPLISEFSANNLATMLYGLHVLAEPLKWAPNKVQISLHQVQTSKHFDGSDSSIDADAWQL